MNDLMTFGSGVENIATQTPTVFTVNSVNNKKLIEQGLKN